MHPCSYVASNRCHKSSAAVASLVLSISMFDHSYNHHRDSTSSIENLVVEQPGRASWARHCPIFPYILCSTTTQGFIWEGQRLVALIAKSCR